MKHWTLRALLFLLLGAAINAALAWAATLTTDWPSLFGRRKADVCEAWPADAPSHWPATMHDRVRCRSPWLDAERHFLTVKLPDNEWRRRRRDYGHDSVTSGWPLRSFRWVHATDSTSHLDTKTWGFVPEQENVTTTGLSVPWRNQGTRDGHWGRLPLKPLWPGFVLNTVVFAMGAFGLTSCTRLVRQRQRVRRGRCGACGYPAGTSPVCSECGKPLNPRSAPLLVISTSSARRAGM